MSSDINSTTTQMLLLLFCWILTAESGVKCHTCGSVEPVDPYFFIGEKLDLSCTVYNISSNQTVQLYFVTSENKMGKWKDKKMNPSLQLNNTAIRLISPELTITDAKNHYISRRYRCMVQKMVNECTSKNKKAIDNQRVRIDYFPQKPENFSCQVYNWEKMTCMWNMITYFHKKDISITFFWKANQTCEGNLLNYTVHESATSFTIPNFEMRPNYCFYFEINNVVRNVRITTDVYHISPPEIVKPAPVANMSYQIINETCVTVAWDKSKQFGEENHAVYRVRHMSECSTEQQFHLLERIATVCGLNPFTNYTLIVDSRPRNMNGSSPLESFGFISDPQNVNVTTSASVPAYNPKLLSFRDVSPSKTPYRCVLLYWEPLSSCDLHDRPSSQQYEIITKQRGSEETWNFTVYNSEATSYSLTLPDKEKVYEVKLRVITGHGKKREDFSHLVIWPKSQSPIAPNMVLEYATMKNGTEFYVTLNLTEAQSQTTQILYWCKVSQESGCLKQMSHIEINGNSTKLSIKDYKMDIIFGVESRQWLLKEIVQSGIQMVNCIYPKDQRPLIPPKHFHIAKGMAEREGELSLEWDPYDCNSPELESGYVLSYNLYYCQVTDESCNMNNSIAYSLHTISVEGYIYSYTIRNLQPGSRYKVWLTARTSAGEGPSTDVIYQDIFIQEFPLWGKIATPVGFVILILAIAYYLFKFYQYVRDRKNAFGMIQVPDTRFQILNTDSYVQIQTSNGHVMVDNQSAAAIPDMSESEELNRLIPITPTLDAKIEMAKSSSLGGILLDLWKSDQIQQETSFSSIDKGCYISIRNRNSASIDIASDRDIYDDKEINGDVLVLNSGYGYQNANLLPEDYSRAVSNEDCVTNSESCSALYEDSLDYTFFKLQGQAVHSHLIDGPDLQGLLLDECKGNNCEREKNVYSVCLTENSPQEHVITEKQTETVHMKSKDDFESNELSLSGDDLDDGTSDDSLSLLDEIISFDKTEEKSGYVCADEVQNEVEESIHSFNPRKYNEYSNIRKNILGSNDEHIKHESDNTRSDCDHMRSENDHLRSDANELIHKFNIDYINCSIGDAVIHPYMNIVQSGIPVDELVGQKEN